MKKKFLMMYFRLLGNLAHRYLKKHKPIIIGINGSVGKTSCRMIIAQTLREQLPSLRIETSPKNFNGELGLSLAVFQIESFSPTLSSFVSALRTAFRKYFFGKNPYDVVILEYGIDRPGEMEFLLTIAKPDIGVFTAIDAVHSLQFGNPVQIAKEEIKMVQNTRELVFLNESDPYAMQIAPSLEVDVLTYQTEGESSVADISFAQDEYILQKQQEKQEKQEKSGSVGARFLGTCRGKQYQISTNLLGKPNYGYILVALTIAETIAHKKKISLHFPPELELSYELQAGRTTVFEGIGKSILIDSTYNASPGSVKKLIETTMMIKQKLFPKKKIWLVLGDMRELGDLTEREHRLLAAYVSQTADEVFLVGKEMALHLVDELQKQGYATDRISCFSTSKHAGLALRDRLHSDGEEVILLAKGSQNTIFLEEAVKMLLIHESDKKKLTRQGAWRDEEKKAFFKTFPDLIPYL